MSGLRDSITSLTAPPNHLANFWRWGVGHGGAHAATHERIQREIEGAKHHLARLGSGGWISVLSMLWT